MKKNSMSYTAIFSFIITFILVFLLALTHNSTKPRVAEYNKNYEIASILKTIGIEPNKNKDKNNLQQQFKSIFNLELPTNTTMSAKVDNKDIIVSKFSGKALWGSVNGIIAMDKNLETIIGIDIISHNETPGLGGRIEEEWFLKQFKNEKLKDNKITIIQGSGDGNYDSTDGIIDGIVGASRTSNSVEVMINQKIRSLRGEK